MAHQEEESRVPVLVAPREESVVDGHRVTFIWKPVKHARSYRLQIAESPAFDRILFETDVRGRSEMTVKDTLPIDERTYFWRVLSRDEDGSLHGGDNVESFISATHDDRALHLAAPDQDEEYGPAARLFHGATMEAAAEATQSPRYVAEESELGVEHEGIEAGQILGFFLAVAVALVLSIVTLFQYVDLTAEDVRFTAAGESGYPELRRAELEATQRLSQYDVADPQQGRYRIPIERAIDLMAEEARQQPAPDYSTELNLLSEDQ